MGPILRSIFALLAIICVAVVFLGAGLGIAPLWAAGFAFVVLVYLIWYLTEADWDDWDEKLD